MTISPNSNSALQSLSGLPLRRGFLIATVLSLLFLVATAYTSAASLLDRIDSTDVMKAATDGVWSLRIAGQMAYFVLAQVVLHVAFGALAWLLALASAVIWPVARQKFGRIIVGWFSFLAAGVIAFNALWYPRTLIGAHYYDLVIPEVGPLHVGQLIYGSIVAVTVAVLAVAAWKVAADSHPAARKRWVSGAVALTALACVALLVGRAGHSAAPAAVNEKPHVILIGIDSLRLEELQRFGGGRGNMPHLDRFLQDADIVLDTTSPAARTFCSWTAILTGRSPRETGARNNLTPRDRVSANPTIGDVLRDAGYKTVYSTDEVRFANIDETYGFDQLITPPIGASDFLIGTYNELPLASVVINTRLGNLLFPFSHGNRGAATMFEPQTYLGRLERELDFEQPTLLITHLTAAHWPYHTAETPFGVSAREHPDDRPMYRIGVRTADSMFDRVVAMLERKGALRNAIVVVLSDHGEALSLPNDSLFKEGSLVDGLGAPLKMLDVGHGQSVLSPTQYKILLGFRSFGDKVGYGAQGRDLPMLATAEDIGPTLLDLLGIPGNPLGASGISLASFLRQPGPVVPAAGGPERVRFTETDLGVLPTPEGGVDEVATARVNSKFFVIDPASARMHVRYRMLPLAHAYKERAAYTSKALLAAVPAGPDKHQYLHFELATGNGRLLLERPGPDVLDGAQLWDALQQQFPGELMPPTRVTMQDWPAIDEAWDKFLINRDAKIAAESAGAATPAAATAAQPTP